MRLYELADQILQEEAGLASMILDRVETVIAYAEGGKSVITVAIAWRLQRFAALRALCDFLHGRSPIRSWQQSGIEDCELERLGKPRLAKRRWRGGYWENNTWLPDNENEERDFNED